MSRYKRYLPTLELKKQQLRAEVNHMEALMDQNREGFRAAWADLNKWVALFSRDIDLSQFVEVDKIDYSPRNIAGINVPLLDEVHFNRKPIDLFATDPWVDDAVGMMEKLIRIESEFKALEKALALLQEELRITSQRVNLFEKVKIPQTKDNIRVIKISLADEQTASVVRAKMTKKETIEIETMTA
jgi:V/A-type H+-transporting ATPase subunit D